MQREQADALLVVVVVHPIHFFVALDHFTRVFAVAINQSVDRFGDLTLDQSAHFQQTGAQAAQILFVLPVGMLRLRVIHFPIPRDQPNRPVM
jgi:hypothetical protein